MRRVTLLVMTLAALGQTYFALRAGVQAAREVPNTLASFRPRSFATVREGGQIALQAYHQLRKLAPLIEDNARVLFLTDILAAFPIEFYLLPSHVLLLWKFPAELSENPGFPAMERALAKERFEMLERREELFTPERLRERMGQCDYVLVYGSKFDLREYPLAEVTRLSSEIVLYRRKAN